MTKRVYVPDTRELGETHLLDLGWQIRQFRVSRGRASRLPYVALWTGRGRSSWSWYLSANASFGECSLRRRAGVDGYSCPAELWRFRWDQVWPDPEPTLYQTNCQLPISLSFPEADCWVSLASFSKSSFGEMSLWSLTRLLLVPLRVSLPTDMSAEGWPLGSRARCRMSEILVMLKLRGVGVGVRVWSTLPCGSGTYWPRLTSFPVEARQPWCSYMVLWSCFCAGCRHHPQRELGNKPAGCAGQAGAQCHYLKGLGYRTSSIGLAIVTSQ